MIAIVAPASAAAEALYRLPWPEGMTFRFGQAPEGMRLTHTAIENLHAVDIPMPERTSVLAAREGVVEQAEWWHTSGPEVEPASFYGNFVRVRHADGTAALYGHLAAGGVTVRPGDRVAAGRKIGESGATGEADEAMLHFGITRPLREGSRWEESLRFRFYVGSPPQPFEPRAALTVTADYSTGARYPHFVLTAPRLPERRLPEQTPETWREGLAILALYLAAGLAGMWWFWRFSRS